MTIRKSTSSNIVDLELARVDRLFTRLDPTQAWQWRTSTEVKPYGAPPCVVISLLVKKKSSSEKP
jgi:hypothetical protein